MTRSAPPVPRLLRICCAALAVALAVPAGTGGGVTPAHAQQQTEERRSGGLLRFLFPRREERVAPPVSEPQRRATTTVRRARPADGQQPVTRTEPDAVEKVENAKRVLVVGDFLASGLAEGLAAAFGQNAEVLVVDRSNGSSGLVRDDHYDWPGNIGAVIEAESPAVVVVMIGSNDRQQMRVEGVREQPRTEAWTAEYERRVTALTSAVRDRNLPLVWVGNLPFRSGVMSSDMIAFNDIYRRIVTDAGGEFVDVWDGFVDENGAFVANGPDMNGQPAQLRASDGINVTRPGRRKIAFYAERPLNRLLGAEAGAAGVARPGPDAFHGPMPQDGAVPGRIDRTVPVSLDEPDADAGATLLGGFVQPPNGEPRTDAERLAREGVAPEAQPGRADDFTIRKPARATDPEGTSALTP